MKQVQMKQLKNIINTRRAKAKRESGLRLKAQDIVVRKKQTLKTPLNIIHDTKRDIKTKTKMAGHPALAVMKGIEKVEKAAM